MTRVGRSLLLPSSSSSSLLPFTLVVVVLSALLSLTSAFYLPGLAPVNYCKPDAAPPVGGSNDAAKRNSAQSKCLSTIPVFVNRLDSVESVLPYEYTHFDFCESMKDQPPSENLGQVLFGERIHSSPYNFTFREQKTCEKVCTKKYSPRAKKEDKAKLDFLRKGVMLNYQHHWIVDNMPVTWCYETDGSEKFCATGIFAAMRAVETMNPI